MAQDTQQEELKIDSIGASFEFGGVAIRSPRYVSKQRPKPEEGAERIQEAFNALNAGRWADALEMLKKIVVYFPEQARLQLYKGLAEANLGQFDQAIKSLEWFLRKEKGNPEGEQLLAKVKSIVDSLPKPSIQTPFEQAISCIENGDFNRALTFFEKLSTEGCHEPGFNYFRALALFKVGKLTEAIQSVSSQLRLTPADNLTLGLKDEIEVSLKKSEVSKDIHSLFAATLKPETQEISFGK